MIRYRLLVNVISPVIYIAFTIIVTPKYIISLAAKSVTLPIRIYIYLFYETFLYHISQQLNKTCINKSTEC